MPTHAFSCQNCGHSHEFFRKSLSTPLPKSCPNCKNRKGYEQDFGGGKVIGRVKGEPKTVGQQAELNRKKMGKELCQKYEEKQKAEFLGDKSEYTGPIPEGGKLYERKKRSGELPWYRKGLDDPTKPLKVSKLPDINRYINEGR